MSMLTFFFFLSRGKLLFKVLACFCACPRYLPNLREKILRNLFQKDVGVRYQKLLRENILRKLFQKDVGDALRVSYQ